MFPLSGLRYLIQVIEEFEKKFTKKGPFSVTTDLTKNIKLASVRVGQFLYFKKAPTKNSVVAIPTESMQDLLSVHFV